MSLDVTASSSDLLRILGRVLGITADRSPTPILGCVLLRTEGASLRVATTDLYVAMTGTIDAEVKLAGSVAVPAKDFADRIKALPVGPIRITADDKHGVVLKGSTGSRKYILRGAPGEEFPPVAMSAGDAPSVSLEADVLARLIERTHFAICADETRAHMNGALFEWAGEEARMVATDGHRLALAREATPGRTAALRMMLSVKTVKELRRHCGDVFTDRPATVDIATSGSAAFFTGGGMTFTAKLVDAQFPPYEQIIPKTPPAITVRVARAPLADTVRAMMLASDDELDVRLIVGQRGVSLESKSDKKGEATDDLPAEVQGKSGFPVRFSARYLLDALGALAGDDAVLGFGERRSDPVRVLSADEADRYVGIVMPRVDR